MNFKIRNKRGGHPILWCGVDRVAWVDLDNFFSIDIGMFFIRLFFQVRKINFCRYWGIIV